ncbi:MAG: tetratricopeptide repeat protein [Gammaproteobacteria bacterium]|jgi:TPR repeat protein
MIEMSYMQYRKRWSLKRRLVPVVAFSIMSCSCLAVTATDITECDRLAAHPGDPEKRAPGVSWSNLDAKAALIACEKAIKRQPSIARLQYQYARILDKQKRYREAATWYGKAAEQGYASAQNSLGYAYERGQGVPANNQKAFYWYKQAAQQGHAQAQNNLGTLYFNGKGVAADRQQALLWYRKAAQQGNATAQQNIGVMYSRGYGVRQDEEAAFNWFLKAANLDNSHAQYNVGMSYFYGKGVEPDRNKAKQWFEKAAVNGNYQASEALRRMQFRTAYCNSLRTISKTESAAPVAGKRLRRRLCP